MPKFNVDYPHVRQHGNIVAVLAHYNVRLNGEGEQRKGRCPFHEDEKPSLSVNTKRNVFNCHACGCSGNIIKLVQLLEPELQNPRRAALQVASLSGIAAKPNGAAQASVTGSETPAIVSEPVVPEEAEPETDVEPEDGVVFNRPLTFTLKLTPVTADDDSAAKTFVDEHGLCGERLNELGVGLAQRGSMKDRLAIPIRNKDHELVAYCGRDIGLLDDANEPTNKFPPKFRKELELYGWEVAQYFDRVVLVERLLPVIKYGGAASKHGNTGFGVASLMDSCISDEQIELLLETRPEVIVWFDGEKTAREWSAPVAARIAERGLWVTVREFSAAGTSEETDLDVFCHAFGVD